MEPNPTPFVGLLGDFVSLAAARIAPDGRLIAANDAFLLLAGGGGAIGADVSGVFGRPTFDQLVRSVSPPQSSSFAGPLQFAGGSNGARTAAAAVLRDEEGLLVLAEVADWVELMEEVTGLRAALAGKDNELARARHEIERQVGTLQANATTDPMTGLANRRSLLERLEMEVARARRYRTPLSLAMAEIDGLARKAGALDDGAADAALQTFARLLRVGCRLCDLPARYGDNRFLIVLPHSRLAGAAVFARRLAAQFAGREISPRDSFSASVGVAEYTENDTPGDLIQRAESALRRNQEVGSGVAGRDSAPSQ